MRKFGSRAKLARVGGAVLAGVAGVVGVVILASPAGAHTAVLSGVAQCANDGTVTIDYTLDLQRSSLTADVTITDSTPAGTTITPDGLNDVPGDNTYHLTQSGVPADAGTASLSVDVVWSDNFEAPASSDKINLPTNCAPPKETTATKPMFTNGTCLSPQPTYTIPEAEGVQYQVEQKDVSPGTYQAKPGDVVEVTAIAEQGFTLTGDKSWSFTFQAVPTDCANAPTVTQPSCTSANGNYTVPTTEGVTYFVNGTETKAGTYPAKAGSTVKITAFGSNGQALPGTTSWTFTIKAAPTDCNAHVPTFVNNTCTSSGHYTIPDSTAGYTVNGVSVTPGTHSATAGTTVTIRAIARPGHPLVGTTSWTHTFPSLSTCIAPAADVHGSGPLANTGPDVPVGQATLVAGLLALFGAGLLFAGRRPNPGRHSVR
ncbi:MAG TPA: hypothetical protein VH373_14020 [Jatrophihabitantaceae bacterium]|jgi:hypothetical protein